MNSLTRGLAAGAAGTTALNAVTYLDMAVRGRPASTTPEESVRVLAEAGGIDLGLDADRAQNREAGLGPLLGYSTALGSAMVYGLVTRHRRLPRPAACLALTGLVMLGSTLPITVLGLTDPREWTIKDWLSDILPHLAYGAVAAEVYEALR